MTQDDGRGALVGEFLQSFFSSPKETQDQIIFDAVESHLSLQKTSLIDPFPVLSHLLGLIQGTSKPKDG